MEPSSFKIVRPVGLGLTPEEIDDAVSAAMAATQDAVDEWNARFTPLDGIRHVDIRIRAKALGQNADGRILTSPWTDTTAFFMALHTGEWRVLSSSLFDRAYDEERRIAMGLGIRWMHWPRLQRDDPGCWTFAADDRRQPPSVCDAIREAIAFADTAMLPEQQVRETMSIFRGEKKHVCSAFRVDLATLDRRLKRLGIVGPQASRA